MTFIIVIVLQYEFVITIIVLGRAHYINTYFSIINLLHKTSKFQAPDVLVIINL